VHLYAAFLGGPIAGDRMGEDHEVVFVVADDAADAKARAKTKWGGVGRCHVDAVQRVDRVDGYQVALSPDHDAGSGRVDVTVIENYN
jgi:Domain of Unknown Function (DUF1543)